MTPRTAAWLAVAALIGLCVAVYASGVPASSGREQGSPANIASVDVGHSVPAPVLARSPKPPQRTPESVNTSKRAPASLSGSVETVVFSGLASCVDPAYGPTYLALPQGVGWKVRITGPHGHVERVSTDTGPEAWTQRIADVSAADMETLLGEPCIGGPGSVPVSIVIVGRQP